MGTLKEDIKTFLKGNIENCPRIFLDFAGDSHFECITVSEYGSDLGNMHFDYGIAARFLQISVKCNGYKKTEDLCYFIYELLNSGLTEEEKLIELDDGRKVIARPKQLPFLLQKDKKGMTTFAFNLIVHTNLR